MNGIAIPIAFDYNYRGQHYGEINLYFSFEDTSIMDIDILSPGRAFSKEINHLTQRGTQGEFDYLIPISQEDIDKYSAPPGRKHAIRIVNSNPTTATYFQRVELLPCKENNLNTMVKLAGFPDFYISFLEGVFNLWIKNENGEYVAIPAQNYSPTCFHDFAHSVITLKGKSSVTPIYNISEIDWNKVLEELTSKKVVSEPM